MFGQNQNKTFTFGAGQNTFGAANASSPFGATFGAPAASGGFGTQNTAVNKPLFGGTATQQTASSGLFGGLTGAAGTATGNLFGQPAVSTSNTFGLGQPASSTGTGLFSSTPSMGSFGFGAGTAMGGTGTGLFGGGLAASTGVAPTNPGGGLFGGAAVPAASTASTGLFGTTSGLFGGGTGSAFGANAGAGNFGSMQQGTTTKFEPTAGTDTMMKNGANATVQTKHQCITAMKAYENKSFEELRFEDYSVGRKGPQSGSTGAATMFGGSAQPQAPQQTFGFQATSTSGFPGPAGTGLLFGQTPVTTSSSGLFSNPTQPVSQAGSFGTPAGLGTGSLFGQNQSGLFGSSAINKPMFGATPAASTSNTLFGAPAGNASLTFGATQSHFGATPASGTAGMGLMGTASAAKQPFTLGGNTSSAGGFTSFAPTIGSGLFSSALQGQQTAGGLFGQPAATSATGAYAFPMTNTSTSGGLFGSTAQPQQQKSFAFSSGFPSLGSSNLTGGLSTSMGQPTSMGMFPSTFSSVTGQSGPTATSALAADFSRDVAMQQQVQTQMLALTNSPYGDSPLFRNLSRERTDKGEIKPPTDPSALKAVLSSSQLKVNSRPLTKLTPRPLSWATPTGSGKKAELFDGLEEDSSFGIDSFVPRRSVKKLTVRDIINSSRPSSLAGSSMREEDDVSPVLATKPGGPTVVAQKSQENASRVKEYETLNLGLSARQSDADVTEFCGSHPDDTIVNLNIRNRQKSSVKPDSIPTPDHSLDRSSTSEQDGEDDEAHSNEVSVHPAGIKLTRPDYYTIPSPDELAKIVDSNGDCFVQDFTVGRKGYGSVFFPGMTNVAGLNLDEIVHFRRKEVTVYPDDETKPQHGTGLNKKAEVTLHCVWPIDKSTHSPIQDVERLKSIGYHDKVELATIKIGAKFIDYRPETGSWVFEVKHFSKYGLLDESDEDEGESATDQKTLRTLQPHDVNMLGANQKGGSDAPRKLAQQQVEPVQPLNQTTTDSEDHSDVENTDVSATPVALHQPQAMGMNNFEDIGDVRDETYDVQPVVQHFPASHMIAGMFGVRTESLQKMKASFFDEDEEDGADQMDWQTGAGSLSRSAAVKSSVGVANTLLSSTKVPPQAADANIAAKGSLVKSKLVAVPSLLLPEHDYPLLSSGADDSLDEESRDLSWRPTVTVPYNEPLPVSLAESSMFAPKPALVDAASFMGRRCRASWGPGNIIVHCGSPIDGARVQPGPDGYNKQKFGESPFRVTFEQVHVRTNCKSEFLQVNEDSTLNIQLSQSVMSVDDKTSKLPFIAPAEGVAALHAYVEQNLNDLDACPPDDDSLSKLRHWVLVWELCVALWGQLPDLTSLALNGATEQMPPYKVQHARREAFSRWLAYAASLSDTATAMDRAGKHSQIDEGPVRVFKLLSDGCIHEACQAAIACGDHRLSLLLAQSGTSHIVKQYLQRQLDDWRKSEMDQFITEDRLRVYALLAGHMLWPTSRFDSSRGYNALINVCQDLDWKRALGLHFWYTCPASTDIRLAVRLYDSAAFGRNHETVDSEMLSREAVEPYVAPPLPPYVEEGGSEEGAESDAKDTCYHLLKLYCDRSYRIDRLFSPMTWTDDPLDYQLSWHLMVVLDALHYGNLLTSTCRAAVHARYADQLEAAGQWHWAAFVLLHIEDMHRRLRAIKNLLSRNVLLDTVGAQDDDDYLAKEDFVIRKLCIPAKYLHEAKAIRALHEQKYREQATHLIQAGQLNEAHRVILQHVAPLLIITEDYDTLKEVLTHVGRGSQEEIQDWDSGGRVYLDYLMVMEVLERMKLGEHSAQGLHQLQLDVISLARRLSSLHCPTARHRLGQAEMAKSVAVLLRSLLSSSETDRESSQASCQPSAKLLVPYLTLLPLPEDYSLQELRDLVTAYSLEFAA